MLDDGESDAKTELTSDKADPLLTLTVICCAQAVRADDR